MVILPQGLPEASGIKSSKITTVDKYTANKDFLRVLFLNLMPEKQASERYSAFSLAESETDVLLVPIKIRGQQYKTTPQAHMDLFYKDFECVKGEEWDGLIITGAPLENIDFEEVRYWKQLQEIMDWADCNIRSTFFICWAAQAALYHRYGIPKHMSSRKKFGVYAFENRNLSHPLLSECSNIIHIPISRHTEVKEKDFITDDSPKILCAGVGGVAIAADTNNRDVYVTGHLEYPIERLDFEYHRDLGKNLPITKPANYYINDDEESGIDFRWKDDSKRIYNNWIEHFLKDK